MQRYGLKCWMALVLILCADPVLLSAGPTHLSDCSALQTALKLQWQADSAQIYLYADDLLVCYLQDGFISIADLRKGQADTLLRLFEIGRLQDRGNQAHWLAKRAGFALLRKEIPRAKQFAWLMEASALSPETVPMLFFTAALQVMMEDYEAGRLSLVTALQIWAQLDRLLLLRELSGGENALQTAEVHKHYRLLVRNLFPDCAQLNTQFSAGIASQSLPPAEVEAFLILYQLQGCDIPSLWELAFAQVDKQAGAAWLLQLAAAEAYNAKQWEECRSFSMRVLAMEPDRRLQAAAQLQIANALLSEHDYRGARAHVNLAIAAQPSWGEPYIKLMDIYLEGQSACSPSDFERKALNWLLLDICQQTINADPNYAGQAHERAYKYRLLAPSLPEAAFQGFPPGSTYPLKCWMSTSTTVPMN